jgi:hypothetical protein
MTPYKAVTLLMRILVQYHVSYVTAVDLDMQVSDILCASKCGAFYYKLNKEKPLLYIRGRLTTGFVIKNVLR